MSPLVFKVPENLHLDLDPIRPNWIVDGTPQARSTCLARSADRTSALVVWSCTPGRFNWHYLVDETLYILSGEVVITEENGQSRRLTAGDVAYFPAGSCCLWHVLREVRKVAMCRHTMHPLLGFALRAWNKVVARATGVADAEIRTGGPTVPAVARSEPSGAQAIARMRGVIDKAAAHP